VTTGGGTHTGAGWRLWPDEVSPEERAVLERGSSGAVVPRPDVLVVGGGVMGVLTAAACERAGLGSVLLVERGHLGSGATGGAAGLLTPEPHHRQDPPALVELGRDSLAGWRRIEAAVPGGVGVVDLQWLGLVPGGDVTGWSPAAVAVDAEAVAAMVPGLGTRAGGVLIGGMARVNPLQAVARLAGSLRSAVTGVAVTAVDRRGGSVRAVETSAGTVSQGAVVFATGGPPAVPGLAVPVPADAVKGHMLVTEAVPAVFDGAVDPLGTQLADGRFLVGGTLDAGDTTPAVRPPVVAAMLAGLARWLPAFADVVVERAWTCFRPHHPDGLPIIDRVPGADNAWFTSGHYRTGILMAPATAAILATWVQTGRQPPPARAFGAERTFDRAGPP
jgi:glycine/D-amino acid oxidase-like deaminating enzyme